MTDLSLRTHSAAVAAVTDLFHQKVEALSLKSLRRLASALEGSRPDAEKLVQAVISTASDSLPPRALHGGGLGRLLSAEDGRASLDAAAVDDESTDWAASELLGAGETAERVGVARTSLDNWRRVHKVLAFRKGVRNYVYPVRQFDRQRPVDGLDRVRVHFPDDEAAWEWLVEANERTGGVAPIEHLRKGKVEDVVRAAEGALDYQ